MAQRRVRVDTLTELMREGIAHTSMRDAELTSGGADAASYTVDATIERLQTLDQGSWMEVTCQLRLSLSDHRGKILAMFTKGAAVRSAKAEFGPAKEQALQRDVLAGTLRSLERDITRFLNNQPQRTK